jgi:hypothetical protein
MEKQDRSIFSVNRLSILLALLLAFVAGGWSFSTAHAQNAATSTCSWQSVTSPDGNYTLVGVSTSAANDAWAVGRLEKDDFTNDLLLEHFDGTAWSVATPAEPASYQDAEFLSVTDLTADNAWAVGDYTDTTGNIALLVEHWDGTNWNIVSAPVPAGARSELHSITAINATNIWAVGFYLDAQYVQHSLTEHWNGTQWKIVSNPGDAMLTGVAASTGKDVWAVGSTVTPRGDAGTAFAMHWDGTAWNVATLPSTIGLGSSLQSIDVISSTDAWAIGSIYSQAGSSTNALALHWDGTQWTQSTTPTPLKAAQPAYVNPTSIVALSATNIWAVGTFKGNTYYQTLVMHWNGSEWKVVASPTGATDSGLASIARVPTTRTLLAVGSVNAQVNDTYVSAGLILSRCQP